MQFLCEWMNIDSEIDKTGHQLKSCLLHQISQEPL